MSLPAIERFESDTGVRIYRIPAEAFPNFIVYCYVLIGAGVPTLVDTGSGYGNSNEQVLAGIRALKTDFGEAITEKDIQRILISHGHIDHFGGVAFMVEQTGAAVGIHEIDRRVLTNYEERVIVATKDLRVYLERAGVSEGLRARVIEMYGFSKKHVNSVKVSINLQEETPLDGMTFIHTPGHCPGQVCIRLGDTLLAADHILARTTPHQAPESITHYTGLGHYLDSLQKIARMDGIRLSLGGHEEPLHDVYERIVGIRASHQRKLDRVIDAINVAGKPLTISEISKHMYPDIHGYDVLLALEEVGAHVEYLYEHGHLAVDNLDEVERENNPALQYGLV
ncbi:MAG: MBL fold metallo-hydrolase [Chloroflexi bacterium]|nr:MBL fold metallo-hydrolase [Chloroflexota bacterium]MCC6897212.1 MBL fold metallo-hydrolase [Anaerolineae bacterium]